MAASNHQSRAAPECDRAWAILIPMCISWIIATFALWALVLFLGFLLLGVLRNVGSLTWRLEKLEATTPGRLNRSGLRPGKPAPDFLLPRATAGEVSLREFSG